MTRDEFWQVVDKLIAKTGGNLDRFTTALDGHLKKLPAREIEEFARHYAELQNEANTPGVLEAAFIIGCGESNDGFMDFRRWIVFQGKDHFSKIVSNPDFLGKYDRKSDPIESWYCEYDPMWIYERTTGDELRNIDVDVYPSEASDYDDSEKLQKRYPKLWKRMQKIADARASLGDRAEAMFLNAKLDRIEAEKRSARFVFSTGAAIHIRNYWPQYRSRYNIATKSPCYDDHPMLGQTVVSITKDFFPTSFFMWFENRKKLSFGCEEGDCSDFEVLDNGVQVDG